MDKIKQRKLVNIKQRHVRKTVTKRQLKFIYIVLNFASILFACPLLLYYARNLVLVKFNKNKVWDELRACVVSLCINTSKQTDHSFIKLYNLDQTSSVKINYYSRSR